MDKNSEDKQELSKNVVENNSESEMTLEKSSLKKISQPTLKKIVKNRKNNIVKFKLNYAGNLGINCRYFITKKSIPKYVERNEKIKSKEIENKGMKVKNSTNKKKWLNFTYFALNILVIVVVLWVQLAKEENPVESLTAILEINWGFIFGAFGLFLLCMLLEQLRFAVLIKKATGIYRFGLAYKVAAIGRHYDVITPLSTGGQPFQIFYMNKYGINAGESISVAMGKYIFTQIVFFAFISFILFRNLFTQSLDFLGSVSGGLVTTLSWIGYACTAVLIITVLFVSLNRRAGAGLVAVVLKLLSKIKIGKFRIVKDYKKSFVKVMRTVNEWQSTTKKYSKSLWVVFASVAFSLLYFICSYSIPYFIYCAFAGWDPSVWISIVTIAVMVDLSSAFNPIPMGVGTADLSFTVLYGVFFTSIPGAQIWALIIWRILNYYIYILQGLGVLVYDYTLGNRRLQKNKEIWLLPYKERIKLKKKSKEITNK